MFEDLADAVESYKERGFIHTFEIEGNNIVCKDLNIKYYPEDVRIVESYRHELMTDPGTDATVFAIQSSTGIKGFLIAGYGIYADPDKAALISKIMRSQHDQGRVE